jgi:hypothetical protein
MKRDDIVFDGKPEKMSVGVHADGKQDTIHLYSLSVSVPQVDVTVTPTP